MTSSLRSRAAILTPRGDDCEWDHVFAREGLSLTQQVRKLLISSALRRWLAALDDLGTAPPQPVRSSWDTTWSACTEKM